MTTSFVPFGSSRPLSILVDGAMPDRDPDVEHCWAEACAGNPRLFDGSILAVRAIDAPWATIHARPERFSHVVCNQPRRSSPVTILSVTGLVEAIIDGRPSVLVARRGEATRSYPGMWEFAPAGGLALAPSPSTLGLDHVLSTLRAEMREEVGLSEALLAPRTIGVVIDPAAHSVDIVVRARLSNPSPMLRVDEDRRWECAEARWVAVEALGEFLAVAPGGVIEPTRAIGRGLGWVG